MVRLDMSTDQKNLRLLGLEESPARQSSLQETIAALRGEIDKGAVVYNREELATLERKLTEAEGLLRALTLGG